MSFDATWTCEEAKASSRQSNLLAGDPEMHPGIADQVLKACGAVSQVVENKDIRRFHVQATCLALVSFSVPGVPTVPGVRLVPNVPLVPAVRIVRAGHAVPRCTTVGQSGTPRRSRKAIRGET